MRGPRVTGEYLRQRYHAEGMSIGQIALECGLTPHTVHYHMKRFGIPRRTLTEALENPMPSSEPVVRFGMTLKRQSRAAVRVPGKLCTKCGSEGLFSRDKQTKDGFKFKCNQCVNANNRARRKANPEDAKLKDRTRYARDRERIRERTRRGNFQTDLENLWIKQDGCCKLCGEPMLRAGKDSRSVCVDHDRSCCARHKSCGRCVRGLLHLRCNALLGHALDNPQLLRKAAEFLERWRKD